MRAGSQAKSGDIIGTNYIQKNILLPLHSKDIILKFNYVFYMGI